MTGYVVGLAFNEAHDRLVLIEKQKPLWQAGKLNGVGGKIEPGETSRQAMVREFREETGVQQPGPAWMPFAKLTGYGKWATEFEVHFFRTTLTMDQFISAHTVEAEQIVKVDVAGILDGISFPMVRNLRLLAALALDESGLDLPVDLFEDLNRENGGR